ncbi:hypothetical protein BDA99DRAFT_290495 [Phascolomyces articulosus]|uniref:Uncharacterized protein n=1 Tax=Phascolomyces articulosus TaxID=60185 RepID=A0AAD5JXD8_9FUNG|nr:hypothetical protein BDA99DRAFT_290495 [Phascolomyces articulosus]
MSAQKYPTINRATTLYNTLFNHLENYTRSNSTAHPGVKEAASHAFEKLKKYYTQATQPVYAISQALNPRCRYSWWSYVGWPQDWIENAKKQVEDEWAKYVPVSSQQQEPSFDADYDDYEPEDIEEDALAAYVAERHRPRVDKLRFWKGREEASGG